MNNKALEILKLYDELGKLLKDDETIADLKRLYKHNPEMFKNMKKVLRIIKELENKNILKKVKP